jgi:hypothetical protein
MTVNELIERIREESPDALKNLDDRWAARLLRTAFATIAADLETAADGTYRVAALGVFRVRTTTPDAEGKGGGRRILFKSAIPRPPAGE